MKIEPLDFSHQSLLSTKLKSLNSKLSEYSFSTLYLFRAVHQYEVIYCENEIFLKGIMRDKTPFIMPTAPPNQLSIPCLKKVLGEEIALFPIETRWLNDLGHLLKEMSFKEEDTDYLYFTAKFSSYSGHDLSKKRNLVKQLFETHEIQSKNLTSQLIVDAQLVLEDWQNAEMAEKSQTDYFACLEGLIHFNDLQLHGRIVYLDGQPKGFMIGEWITPDCYLVHFSKANRSIKGLYQFMVQDLAKTIEKTCTWINLEQDLGLPSLRESKHSYQPDQLLLKWRLKI